MLIVKTLWLLVPAGFANMAPIFAKIIFPRWNRPVDLGKSWRGKEIFGSHKTYRGLISGALMGFVVFFFQQVLYREFAVVRELSFFDYNDVSLLFGAWMGLGALVGDLIKSFFKRQISIAPGGPWVPFDQIDWIVGALVSICFVFIPNLSIVLTSFAVGLCLHSLTKLVGYALGINEAPV